MIGEIVHFAIKASEAITKITSSYKSANQTVSLNDVAKSSQVMPFVVVGNDCLHLEYLPDILQSTQSMFCGIYLRALSLMSTVDNVKVVSVLNKVNPVFEEFCIKANIISHESYNSKFHSNDFRQNWKLSPEAYQFRLPTNENELAKEVEILSLEATAPQTPPPQTGQTGSPLKANRVVINRQSANLPNWTDPQNELALKSGDDYSVRFHQDNLERIEEVSNLSIGKTIIARFKINDQDLEFPVHFKLLISSLPDNTMSNYLSSKKSEYNFAERFYDYKSGRIKFWRDLVFCDDIFKNQAQLLLQDKENVIQTITERATKNRQKIFKAGVAGKDIQHAAGSSNIWIMSSITSANIESKMGSRLVTQKTRDAVMDAGYAIMLVVIDKRSEQITFYTRGIAEKTTLGIKDIKISNKNKGPDIGDILKAYQLGNSPSF